jgi:hypothetical protein
LSSRVTDSVSRKTHFHGGRWLILSRSSSGVNYKEMWSCGLNTGFIWYSPLIILDHNLQSHFSQLVSRSLSLFHSLLVVHYTHLILSVCSSTPVFWYRLPTADVPLPRIPNCPSAIATATLFSQCALHLVELPPPVQICTVWSPPDNCSSGALYNNCRLLSKFGVSLILIASQSVSMSWCREPLWDLRPSLLPVVMLLSERCGLVSVERPLWREDESATCSAITQLFESRRTRNHTLLFYLRLPQPEGPSSRRNRVAQLYPRALSSLFVASCDSQGYGGGILTLP